MPTAEARVETERPSRYLVQLCKHFDNKGRHLGHRPRAHGGGDALALREMQAVAAQVQVDWTDTQGTVSLPWGRCEMRAVTGVLMLHLEADDEANLGRLQELVSGHIERFGRREELKVAWDRLEPSTASSGEAVTADPEPRGATERRRWRGRTTVLAAVGVVAVSVHLGLGGILLANWQWTGWAVGAVLAVVLVKVVVLTGLGRFVIRRGSKAR